MQANMNRVEAHARGRRRCMQGGEGDAGKYEQSGGACKGEKADGEPNGRVGKGLCVPPAGSSICHLHRLAASGGQSLVL